METVLKLCKVVTNSDKSKATINEYNHEYIDRLFNITTQVKKETPEDTQTRQSIEYTSQDKQVDQVTQSDKYKNLLDTL